MTLRDEIQKSVQGSTMRNFQVDLDEFGLYNCAALCFGIGYKRVWRVNERGDVVEGQDMDSYSNPRSDMFEVSCPSRSRQACQVQRR